MNDHVLYTGLLSLLWLSLQIEAKNQAYHVPDEQRLYRDLMSRYENSVRPVLNASSIVLISFRLSLNQIVDLDERRQVLTTNVFVEQEWEDQHLIWDTEDYNGIKTLRVPAELVWLPDTYIFNNADEGSTGFMQGVYVVLTHNGSVKWPVPVKLKSSCKVDITYFPFDGQQCILRFGSWIYSAEWIDFESSLDSVDLQYYIDNSEWELVAIQFEKSVHKYACCPDPHSDLTYILHMRRRTFYYLFNIIVPCIMLSILTLLTFWLPTTSGEKISLGLSVFLAFSMFMLLIAEEVPATSESVPLIGVYLTTVMTMTSVSVIMSVMVINLYNRGYRAQPSPAWLKVLILNWLCRLVRMKHDIERLAQTIKLEEEEEAKFLCDAHDLHLPGVYPRRRGTAFSPRPSPRCTPHTSPQTSPDPTPRSSLSPILTQLHINHIQMNHSNIVQNNEKSEHDINNTQSNDKSGHDINNVHNNDRSVSNINHIQNNNKHVRERLYPYESGANSYMSYPDMCNSNNIDELLRGLMEGESPSSYTNTAQGGGQSDVTPDEDDDEPVWKKRDTLVREQREALLKRRREINKNDVIENKAYHNGKCHKSKTKANHKNSEPGAMLTSGVMDLPEMTVSETIPMININDNDKDIKDPNGDFHCKKKHALRSRREIVVEWQTMAMVIDRLLFWIFLIATVVAYIVILLIVPYSNKPKEPDDNLPVRFLHRHS